jgi:hypothetical protein
LQYRVSDTQNGFIIRSSDYCNLNKTIEFHLPHPDHVTIAVYNITGRMVTSLVNDRFEAGAHSMLWNIRSLPNGFYTIKMNAGKISSCKTVSIVQ